MKLFCLVLALLLLSLILQEFMPVFEWAYGARLLLVHTVFFAVAVSVPFPAMLMLALATGFLWDARYYVPIYADGGTSGLLGQAELPFGFSILLFAVAGAIIQGVCPLFRKGRWELPILLIGLCTALVLVLEYLVIGFHRGALAASPEFWWQVVMTALFSSLVSPFLLLLLSSVAGPRSRARFGGPQRRQRHDGDAL